MFDRFSNGDRPPPRFTNDGWSPCTGTLVPDAPWEGFVRIRNRNSAIEIEIKLLGKLANKPASSLDGVWSMVRA